MMSLSPLDFFGEDKKKVTFKTVALSVIGLAGAIAIRDGHGWKITALSVVGYVTACQSPLPKGRGLNRED
ncbi:MAG: hypothetical protein KR126chlam6_00865 [Candidatus Anoxychlamydiales bacterium]|nr:hypothetical protein [Candidatus Anoxychlamydiales bacterium]